MSLGVSVCDFIVVGKIIFQITNALRNSRCDYQELIRELDKSVPFARPPCSNTLLAAERLAHSPDLTDIESA